MDKIAVQIDGRTLTLTNLAKVLYPADGFTKAEVLDYYQRISPVLLPHITGRPMTLKRYPDGVDGESFFAKHAPAHRPGWIRTEDVQAHSSRARAPGTTISYLVLDDLPALIWAANLAGLELHVPMWRFPPGPAAGNAAKTLPPAHDREPDLLVFDLDPGPPATIVECCRVAEALRPLLESDGLRPLAKTSGGKGLQLYATIGGRTAEQASGEALAYAQRMEAELPGLAVSRMTKTLREGKVLIDWSQNNGSKTTIAPYSLRARVHPTVSAPVTWDEVTACRHPDDLFFTAPDVLTRVAEQGDLFAPLLPLPHTPRSRTAPARPALSRRAPAPVALAVLPAPPARCASPRARRPSGLFHDREAFARIACGIYGIMEISSHDGRIRGICGLEFAARSCRVTRRDGGIRYGMVTSPRRSASSSRA